jgi:transcriptional regulator with XRE-family HTH domain
MIDKSQETILLVGLGSQLKNIRKRKGLSLTQLSHDCNMEKASLSRIESGKVNVSYLTLYRLSKCLNVELHEFFLDGAATDFEI